ncbi:MAG: hypothetical protein HQ539_00210, partial [Parcubacteria group bacterium]|nr:hypothetical protein [Parcubacteria group bacterium]
MFKLKLRVVGFFFSVAILSLTGVYIARAWVEPTQAPPNANVSTPINVGSTAQGKMGNLGVGISSPQGKLHIAGGNILLDNTRTLQAKNSEGTIETWMWPRWSDNIMYTNFGSGGWNIRNNSSQNVMFMTNSRNIGIGDTSPDGSLKLDVEGQVGATGYCDQSGNNCKTIIELSSGGIQTLGTSGDTITLTGSASITAPYATNAGKLSGYSLSTTRNAANTVPVRDGNGYLQLGWINTTSGSAGTNAPVRIYGSHDSYLRYYTPANFATVMDGYQQKRVTGTCAAGSSIRIINENGTVTCETDDAGVGGDNLGTHVASVNLNMNDLEVQNARALQGKDWDDNTGGTDSKYRLLFRDGANMFYNGGVVVGGYANGTWTD